MSFSGWLGVAAFALVVLELVAAGVGVHLVRKFWRQVEPQVRPLLAMFVGPASSSSSTAPPPDYTLPPPGPGEPPR